MIKILFYFSFWRNKDSKFVQHCYIIQYPHIAMQYMPKFFFSKPKKRSNKVLLPQTVYIEKKRLSITRLIFASPSAQRLPYLKMRDTKKFIFLIILVQLNYQLLKDQSTNSWDLKERTTKDESVCNHSICPSLIKACFNKWPVHESHMEMSNMNSISCLFHFIILLLK
jgi:hypothetical protein